MTLRNYLVKLAMTTTILVAGLIPTKLSAQQIQTSAMSGPWNTGSTWTSGIVPAATDTVIIQNTHVVVLDVSATVDSLIIQNGGTLEFQDIGPYTLTVNGNFINDGTCHINNTDAAGGTFVHTIDFKRNFLNNGTFSGALDLI